MGKVDKPVDVSTEIRRRIRVAVAAYAYEVHGHSIMPDHDYDNLSRLINPQMLTDDPQLDAFFRKEFSPDTGMWIHRHPELGKIEDLYWQHFARSR